jgi:superoxide dismutase
VAVKQGHPGRRQVLGKQQVRLEDRGWRPAVRGPPPSLAATLPLLPTGPESGEPASASGERYGRGRWSIDAAFGSYDKFKAQFADAAATQFGSGWAWLVLKGGKLAITKTANADTPMAHGEVALLTIDVWEHAYYVDFRNARPAYITTFLDSLVNWDFVAENFAKAS